MLLKKFILLGGLVGVPILLIGILLLSIFLTLNTRKVEENHETGEKSFQYQYLQRNHLKNETSFGIVQLGDKIRENDFLYYESDMERNEHLISNFGEQEYECIGTCYCEEGFSQRRFSGVAGIFRQGITYLLVSVSSVLAINEARKYFSEECKNKLSDSCSLSSIKSDVDECNPITEDTNFYNDDTTSKDDTDIKKRTYFCYGNCVNHKVTVKYEETREAYNKLYETFKCEKLKREGEVTVSIEDIPEGKPADYLSKVSSIYAKAKFLRMYLTGFCKTESIKHLQYKYNLEKRGKPQMYRSNRVKRNGETYHYEKEYARKNNIWQSRKVALCVGSEGSRMSNMSCRLKSPKLGARNDKWRDQMFWEKKREWQKL